MIPLNLDLFCEDVNDVVKLIDLLPYQRIEIYRNRVERQEPIYLFFDMMDTGLSDFELLNQLEAVRYELKQLQGQLQLLEREKFLAAQQKRDSILGILANTVGPVHEAFAKQVQDCEDTIRRECRQLDVSAAPYLATPK